MCDSQAQLWRQWFAAGGKGGEVDVALRDLYARLDADIAARSPTCWLSGKCCHFDSYGHLLYVTGLEIAWLLALSPLPSRERVRVRVDRRDGEETLHSPKSNISPSPQPSPSKGEGERLAQTDGCPYQQNKLCGVHAVRPLGCRVFYCDPAAQGWQNDVYERYLAELRDLHQRLGLPYRYMEWRAGLTEALAAGKIHP